MERSEQCGWRIWHYDLVGSTNDVAQRLDTRLPCRPCDIIIADRQTKGRGRRGRCWISPKGNLYMSQLSEWRRPIGELVYVVALSAAQALLDEFPNADIKIKWPNDLMLDGKKLGGILIEKTKKDNVIVGIGINWQTAPDPKEVIYPVTCLADKQVTTGPKVFCRHYLEHWRENTAKDFADIRCKWLGLAHNREKFITVQQNIKNRWSGRFIGIDEQGALLLQQDNNEVIKVVTGDVLFEDE